MENTYAPDNGQDLLTDFEINLQHASAGKRFANYLIDLVFFFLVLVLVGIIYYAITGVRDSSEDSNPLGSLADRIIYSLLFAILIGAVEGLFKGKTLGKLITGTRAVNMDGTNISFKTALLRGFSRIVPFEAFSALGSPSFPWHDKWTNTFVIDEKTSTRKES